jgi:predicted nucleic acid-binding protein
MEVVTPSPLATPICRDVDDDNILATAVTGNCECLVTGDKDLLVVKQFQGIDILSPGDFQEYEKIGES